MASSLVHSLVAYSRDGPGVRLAEGEPLSALPSDNWITSSWDAAKLDNKQLGRCKVGIVLGALVGAALEANVGVELGALVGGVQPRRPWRQTSGRRAPVGAAVG